jgi:hypothetical protein
LPFKSEVVDEQQRSDQIGSVHPREGSRSSSEDIPSEGEIGGHPHLQEGAHRTGSQPPGSHLFRRDSGCYRNHWSPADDPDVLAGAAENNRIVLTHDRATMSDDAYARVAAGERMAGVFLWNDRSFGTMVRGLMSSLA